MSDIDHASIEQIVKTSKRHKTEDRMLGDIFAGIPSEKSTLATGSVSSTVSNTGAKQKAGEMREGQRLSIRRQLETRY
ncbi:hypothetical protein [Bradyrhizobium brasilense]|uniref:hypothetical protein n=1 Tax=Bradyrhizobium brasilense TaxID=1419277 RepID=UPI001E47EAFE|nr:hypothetical protein [Bradyrhizobium brasilense]MCC8970096.1 hypothetical protein [Bradyrhizobium brasilense]